MNAKELTKQVIEEYFRSGINMHSAEDRVESLLTEALKQERRSWMSKSDPFVSECMKLALEEGKWIEREECAKVCESYFDTYPEETTGRLIAAQIRARGGK